jgi:hypothetical protein
MTNDTHDQLLRELARMTEAAYRRGFAHGHATAEGHHDLLVHLDAWRFKVPLDRSPSPIGGRPMGSEERLEAQAPALVRRLRRLLEE